MDHHDDREVEEGGELQGADYMIERWYIHHSEAEGGW
jgi:hypothetical protein